MTELGWHHHEFRPHVERPNACTICGRKRVWRWHYGPFASFRVMARIRAGVRS